MILCPRAMRVINGVRQDIGLEAGICALSAVSRQPPQILEEQLALAGFPDAGESILGSKDHSRQPVLRVIVVGRNFPLMLRPYLGHRDRLVAQGIDLEPGFADRPLQLEIFSPSRRSAEQEWSAYAVRISSATCSDATRTGPALPCRALFHSAPP